MVDTLGVIERSNPRWGFRKKLKQLRERSKITKWPDNGLRHSFGSYHVACFQNPNMTALQMGHSTKDTLFNYYRNSRIRKKDAEAYWKLTPPVIGKNLVPFAATTA
jgi:integrase